LVTSAIVKAPSLADRIPLGRFLGAVSGEENTYFHRAFEALSILEADRTRPTLRPTTRAFHDVMADAIKADGYEETLTPLVVFEWLYDDWATAVADRRPESFLHREWITIHANSLSMRLSPGSAISWTVTVPGSRPTGSGTSWRSFAVRCNWRRHSSPTLTQRLDRWVCDDAKRSALPVIAGPVLGRSRPVAPARSAATWSQQRRVA
jgi:hypothetical protein